MHKIDFTQNGGFPLTQDALAYMQQAIQDVLKQSYAHLLVEDNGNFILGGAVQNGLNISAGWLLINGELVKLLAGSGSYIKITDSVESVIFEDTTSKPVYNNKFAEVTTVGIGNTPISEFKRLSQSRNVVYTDCVHLLTRSYQYQLPKFVTSIKLDETGNNTSGFILNNIIPFDGIPNGYQLMVECGGGTALTYLTRNNVVSNLAFNRAEFDYLGNPLVNPFFSIDGYIGSSNNASWSFGYAKNLHVLFSWSSSRNKWIEISRTSGQSI